jgi:ribosomal protein S18 acetylase RimI-like enzyme
MDDKLEKGRTDYDKSITLRRVVPEDEAFLFDLYSSTREEELAVVDWGSDDRREAFLRMQFDAQRTHYQHHYPRAEHRIILRDGQAAGRIWTERNAGEIRILDMAITPAHRGAGIGSYLIRKTLREAQETGRPLRHSVEKNNLAAMRLYERLGFVVIGEIPTHYFLEHGSASARAKE